MKEITFKGKKYEVGFEKSNEGSDFTSDSKEWVTDGETVENWTSLITTHKLSPKEGGPTLSAEAYAQNTSAMQGQQGAMVLETSIINQDMEALGIDPKRPPFLLVYMYITPEQTEFNMQKIVQLSDTEVGAFIYAERFPTKSEEEMREYYESKERNEKRIELIKADFPY